MPTSTRSSPSQNAAPEVRIPAPCCELSMLINCQFDQCIVYLGSYTLVVEIVAEAPLAGAKAATVASAVPTVS